MKSDSWLLRPAILHPLAGCGWKRFWSEYRNNGPYAARSLPSRLCAMASVLSRVGTVRAERRRHEAAVRAHQLAGPPVFIIGHWRSGTTHLHNLLSMDPAFACMSFYQTTMPLDFLGERKFQRRLMGAVLPRTRGMDNVEISPDLPQEEEIGLGILSGLSMFKGLYYPRAMRRHFRQSLFFEDIAERDRAAFRDAYGYLVRKVSYAHGGAKRVLFKNPASTTRIPMLMDLFPDARFIHIVRDPHDVYHSMQRLWRQLVPSFSWQKYHDLDFTETTRWLYGEVMRRYLRDRESVPPGQLVEVRYEDLDARPVATVDAIYRGLSLPDREAARARLCAIRDRPCEADPAKRTPFSAFSGTARSAGQTLRSAGVAGA